MNPKNLLAKIISYIFVVSLWAISLIFFRAETFADAIVMFQNLGFGNFENLYAHGLNLPELKFTMWLLIGLMCVEIFLKKREEKVENFFFLKFFPLRWTIYIALVLATIYLEIYGATIDNTFIYFQF